MIHTLDRFDLRIAPQAEACFLSLPPQERSHLASVLEGIAELAALAPPTYPSWFKRRELFPPLMRMKVAGYLLSYELDCEQRFLRLCALEDLALSPAAREAPLDAAASASNG